MTNEQRQKVIVLRSKKMSYNQIAAELNISSHTISSFCKRIGFGGKASELDGIGVCKCCGEIIHSLPGHKPKMFCSKVCRQNWWNAHPEQVNRRASAYYAFTCENCGTKSEAYGNNHRKYCSHACYISARFGKEPVCHEG